MEFFYASISGLAGLLALEVLSLYQRRSAGRGQVPREQRQSRRLPRQPAITRERKAA
jgi:hypothetical protein